MKINYEDLKKQLIKEYQHLKVMRPSVTHHQIPPPTATEDKEAIFIRKNIKSRGSERTGSNNANKQTAAIYLNSMRQNG